MIIYYKLIIYNPNLPNETRSSIWFKTFATKSPEPEKLEDFSLIKLLMKDFFVVISLFILSVIVKLLKNSFRT